MNKRDALRLTPGTIIVFGNSQFTSKCTYFKEGIVKHVTPRGGILVDVIKHRGDRQPLYEKWVPYNHVC